jgi:hypothetical protein
MSSASDAEGAGALRLARRLGKTIREVFQTTLAGMLPFLRHSVMGNWHHHLSSTDLFVRGRTPLWIRTDGIEVVG